MNLSKLLFDVRVLSLSPQKTSNVLDHAVEHRYLSASASSKAGNWKPYVKAAIEPMLAATTQGVRKITIMSAAQLMKTDYLLNIIFYFASHEPSSMILAQPIEKLAEAFSKDRIDPLINDNVILNSLIKGKRERDSDNNLLLKKFNNGASLSIVSAGSVSDLASRSARIVLMDELDRYADLGTEGDPEKLLEERSNTYFNSLNIAVSTPTNEATSRINNRYQQSSKHVFHAECIHCNMPESLKWANVHWSNTDASTAAYVCSQCGVEWTEAERVESVNAGYYIAENPHITDHLGFHVNAIASPWQTIPQLVSKFLAAKDNPEQLRTFVNLSLAEIWKNKAKETPDWKRLYDRRELYPLGVVPEGVMFLTQGVDVQMNRLESSVYGFTKDKRMYLIDQCVFDGDTNASSSWNMLTQKINQSYPIEGSNQRMSISMTAIDTGYNTTKVYDYIKQFNPNVVRAVKGSDSLLTQYKIGTAINSGAGAYNHFLYSVGSSLIKEQIYSNLKLNKPVDDEAYPSGYIHIPELESEFFQQLTAESYVRNKNKWQWHKLRPRNEALDLCVYAIAAAHMFGLSRFTDAEWQVLTERIHPTEVNLLQRPTAQVIKSQRPQSSAWKYPGLKR